MKFCFVVAIVVVLQLFQLTNTAPLEEKEVDVQYRLPINTVLPIRYNIELTPYILKDKNETFKRFQFEGKVAIKLTVIGENVKEIVLHKKFIEIEKKNLFEEDGTEIPDITDGYDAVTDLYTIKVEKALKKNAKYLLKFEYTGQMKDDMKGFYYSSYKSEDKKSTIYIGSTQFQTHHARRAFPCFDEPALKAKFDITIIHEEEFKKVYSNNELEKTEEIKDKKQIKSIFKTTPNMSTYLVAFLISNFDGREEDDKSFSVIARPEYKSQTKWSFDDGKKLLKALNDITGLKYNTIGIPKMHMAAIPDFSAGAMENWGLLTYRERGLLYDEDETTDSAQQSISLIIAHEQTHMWFGDLVTCNWWNHTWLNEGFATFYQYYAAANVHSDWQLDQQFVIDQLHTVFTTDSLPDTHAMSEKNINTPADLAKMFDSISYNKGASIIRMFKYTMGEQNFNTAIKAYLKHFYDMQGGASEPKILFNHLESQWTNADVNKTAFFLDWTEQVGYPVVTVKVIEDGKKIEVSQKRFLLEESDNKDLQYTIPFTYTTQKKPNFDIKKGDDIKFIQNSEKTKKIDLPESEHLSGSDYLIANIEQIGFYRVLYEEHMLHNIHSALEKDDFGKISEINRAHLIDDLFNFARVGEIKYSLLFNVLSYLKNEKHYIPLTAAFNSLKYIETRLGDNTNDLKTRVHLILPVVYKHLTFEEKKNENRLDKYNRAKVLQWACKYNYADCQKEATSLFEEFKKDDKKKIHKNIRSAIYCSAVRTSEDEKNYKFLETRFKETNTPTEKTLILSSLGCVKDKEHVKKYYEFILSDDVRKQDKSAALNSLISENPGNPELVFDLIEKDPNKLGKALGDGDNDIATIVSNICNRFTTKEQKEKAEKFIEKLSDEKAKDKIKKAIKNIEKNMKWLVKYEKDLLSSLRGGVAAKTFSVILLTFTTILCYITIY